MTHLYLVYVTVVLLGIATLAIVNGLVISMLYREIKNRDFKKF